MNPSLQALNDFIAVLNKIPSSVIPLGSINTVEPTKTGDLPHITVTGVGIKESPIGIGGILLTEKIGTEEVHEILGYKVAMTYCLDIWADSVDHVEEISRGVTEFLFEKREEMRRDGFVMLSLDSIGEIVTTSVRRLIGTATAYERRLEYKGIYEQIMSETLGPGGIIKKINVEIDEQLKESMEIS